MVFRWRPACKARGSSPPETSSPDWDKYRLPPKVRHGSMLPITRKQYDALVAAFGEGSEK